MALILKYKRNLITKVHIVWSFWPLDFLQTDYTDSAENEIKETNWEPKETIRKERASSAIAKSLRKDTEAESQTLKT